MQGGLTEKACHSAVRSACAEAEQHLTREIRASTEDVEGSRDDSEWTPSAVN